MILTAKDIFVVYNAPGASDFHADIVKSILAGGELPEELRDVLSMDRILVDGKPRWIVNPL